MRQNYELYTLKPLPTIVMLLHLVIDDKFIDDTIDLFENVSPGKNKYFIILNQDTYKFTYIKRNVDKIEIININSIVLDSFFMNNKLYSAILFHSLFGFNIDILQRMSFSSHIKVAWFCWGGDGYQFNNDFELFSKKTRLIAEEFGLVRKKITFQFIQMTTPKIYVYRFLKYYKKLRENRRLNHSNSNYIKRILSKVDFFVPVTISDYSILKRLLKKEVKILRFSYGGIDPSIVGLDVPNVAHRKNILIGNSCDPTNNHVEIIDKIKKANLLYEKIIMPLSYPSSSGYIEYRQYLITLSSDIFGSKFYPLIDFMSKSEYNNLLNTCYAVIFNHKRQQAKGNILTAFYLGCTVVMNKNSVLFKDLKDEGFNILTLDELEKYAYNEEAIMSNKKNVIKLYGYDKINRYAKNLVSELS